MKQNIEYFTHISCLICIVFWSYIITICWLISHACCLHPHLLSTSLYGLPVLEFLKILDSFAVHSCSTLRQSNFWNSQLLNIYNYCSSSVEFQMKSWCITYVYMIPHRVCIITMDSIWVSFVFLLVFHVKNLPQGYCLLFFLSFAFCHENDAKRERKKTARERER